MFFIACPFFTGCDKAAKKQAGTQQQGVLETPYLTYTQQLDVADIQSAALAVKQYCKLFTGAGQDSCDEGFVIFENFCKQQCNTLTQLVQNKEEYQSLVATDEWGVTRELTGELKVFSNRLRENGYKVVLAGGKMMVVQDWDLVAARMSRFVSPDVNAYIARMNKEFKETVNVHTQVAVSPETLIENMIWRENFGAQHAAFILQKDMKESHRTLLTSLMRGTDSVFFLSACAYLGRQYPASGTNKIVAPYYKARQEHNLSFANALLDRYYKQGYIYNAQR